MEEQLIELARAKPALYDTNHPDYFKGKVKQDIWREIAKNLKLPNASSAKSVWEKLRNNHRDALRRQRAAVESGVSLGSIKKWRYQKQMEFLLQYMNVRPHDASLEEDRDSDKSQLDFEFVDQSMMLETLISGDGEDDDVAILSHSDIADLYGESYLCASDSNPSNSVNSTPKSSTKKIKIQDGSAFLKEQNEQKMKKKKPPENNSPNDELYYFFLSMYKMTRKMPPASQHTVRKKVFEVVSQAEAELLDIVEIAQRSYQFDSTSFITDDDDPSNSALKFLSDT